MSESARQQKIDVSVIIPAFNRLWSLPKAIASCRGTNCRTEIIVIDDGSTDGTWEWLQQQPDLVCLRQDNLGKDWAVNRGFAVARGEYVRFLDSDDWMLPSTIDGQLQLARQTGVDVVVSGYEQYAEDETLLARIPWVECDDFIAQQLGECESSHYSAYLYRREFLRDIPHRQEYGARDDRMFIIEVAMADPRVAIWPEPAIGFRHHDRNRLQFPRGLRETVTHYQQLTLYKRCLTRLELQGKLTPRRRRAACNNLWPLAHWIARTHFGEACELADWVYQLDPEFQPPDSGVVGLLYRRLGFRNTERLLGIRRAMFAPFRRREGGESP